MPPRRVLVVGPDRASTALLSEALFTDGVVVAQVHGLAEVAAALEGGPCSALALAVATEGEAAAASALATLRAREDGLRHLPVLVVGQGPLDPARAASFRADRRARLIEEPYPLGELRRALADLLDIERSAP